MGRYKKLGKNVLFITVGSFASKVLSFLLVPFYTAILTTEEYGISDLMTTTVNLLMPFLTLLMEEALLRFSLDKEKDSRRVFSTGMFVIFAGIVVFLLFSPLILLSERLKSYYGYFIAYYIAFALHSSLINFTRGIEKIGVYSISGVVQTAVYLLLNVFFLAILKMGIEGYLLAMILGHIVGTIYIFIGAKIYKFFDYKFFDRQMLREMLHYAVPMIPNSISWWISNSSDKYMITLFCGVAATGVYSIFQRIPTMVSVISGIFSSAWMISAVEDFGSEATRAFYSNIYRKYSALNIFVVSSIILYTKPIASLLFSNEFFVGWVYVPVLVFAVLFNSLSSFLGSIYTAAKNTKMVFLTTLVGAVSNLILNAILIPTIGVIGAAISTLVSYVLIWIVRMIDSRKIMKLDWNVKNDVLSYGLIVAQIVLVMIDIRVVSFVGSSIVYIILIIINMREVKAVFLQFMGAVKSKRAVRF